MLRWRLTGIVGWALLAGVLFGAGTEYAPLFDDRSDPSVGRAVAKALFFGVGMAAWGVRRDICRERRADRPRAPE